MLYWQRARAGLTDTCCVSLTEILFSGSKWPKSIPVKPNDSKSHSEHAFPQSPSYFGFQSRMIIIKCRRHGFGSETECYVADPDVPWIFSKQSTDHCSRIANAGFENGQVSRRGVFS